MCENCVSNCHDAGSISARDVPRTHRSRRTRTRSRTLSTAKETWVAISYAEAHSVILMEALSFNASLTSA